MSDSTIGETLLNRARLRAREIGLAYAGDITPKEAWQLFESGIAVLVDVRKPEEYIFVGHVPDSLLIPWTTEADFVKEAQQKLDKTTPILLLCRGAVRSVKAAKALTKAGFMHAFNVLEGFEGERDANGHRSTINGWRFHQLPWIQD